MSTVTLDASPRTCARIGGALYLVIIVAGLFGEMFVRNTLVASGDPAATAHNLLASGALWRVGIAGDLIMHVCDVPLSLVFYVLLRPVDRHLARLAVLFGLVQTAVLAANKLNLILPTFLLGDAAYLSALDTGRRQVLAYLAIKLHAYGFGVGLIFFGCECVVLGTLIVRSGFLPRTIGVLMQVAGACYLANSFALIAAPALAGALFPAIMLPPFVAESSLCLWLLAKGVDAAKWSERVRARRPAGG